MKSFHNTAVLVALALVIAMAARAAADPLTGQTLKFQQLPLNGGLAPNVGGAPYPGHNEWSTAYASYNINGFQGWRGDYMADDFGDTVSTPVYHIKWWGSYHQDVTGVNGVPQFMITFETDVPAVAGAVSHPGVPLLNQIVTKTTAGLSPGSGTFHEKLINPTAPGAAENLYEYNAELSIPFNQLAHDVYWLKIVALVDTQFDGNMLWGWHSRDWSIQNTYASTTFPSFPGENQVGSVVDSNGTPLPVWHFQDNSVTGPVDITPNAASPNGWFVNQYQIWNPQYYIDGIDGPLSPGGISQFSKDLAFELYTRVPEPSSVVLLGLGSIGIGLSAWRRRVKK